MNIIDQASEAIRKGRLVAMPTETVYGLAANAENDGACRKIFALKSRPAKNPLIVHVASFAQAQDIAIFNEDARLIASLWPGPITMVLPKRSDVAIADSVTAGLDTIAIRIPAHQMALRLLNQCGKPLAAPSANLSGRLSSTNFQHVADYFGNNDKDDILILPDAYGGYIESETSKYGLESTIIDLTTDTPTILRYGFITPHLIESVLGKSVLHGASGKEIKAPGMAFKHYSPITNIIINADRLNSGEVGLEFGRNSLVNHGNNYTLNLSESGDMAEAAHNLFKMLHQLDSYAVANNLTKIVVAKVPLEGIGLAINDRLNRAAS